VKWLREITVLAEPFTGFQNAVAYRRKVDADDPGEPITRIQPRALMIPPGFPDFMTRRRIVDAGEIVLRGRAWSGRAPLASVELSTDGGATWSSASLDRPGERYAWRAWSAPWTAAPGDYELCARATDSLGPQPVEQPWNIQGMANNMVQRVAVTVR
jgi:molybdenum-dependent oxidoreductase-like protein